jgi:hypothetical protein
MVTINLNLTIGDAVQEFYDKNDFGKDGGANEKYAWIKFGFFSIPIPNTESRKQNVYLHDVNHIITGNDTTWKGESAVSAWEIASGGWAKLYFPWLLTIWAMGLGVVFYTASVFKAFKKGLTMNNALTCGLSKNEIFKLSISEMRDLVSDKPKRNASLYGWIIFSVTVFLTPFLGALFLIWMISQLLY